MADYITLLLQGPADENDDEEEQPVKTLEDVLPEKFTANEFTSEILGLGNVEENNYEQSSVNDEKHSV